AERVPAGLGARRADRLERRRRRADEPPLRRAGRGGAPHREAVRRRARLGRRLGAGAGVFPRHALAGTHRSPIRGTDPEGGGVTAITLQGLKRRALSLGMVKAFDQAMQFLLPIVLVRCLDAHTFGEYRLLWLAVGTVMALSTLNMGGVLFYFLPRADARKRRLYVHQTLLYLLAAGLVCAWAVSGWNPLLPGAARSLAAYGALVPAFVGLWVFAC